jgi:hypothetical protein
VTTRALGRLPVKHDPRTLQLGRFLGATGWQPPATVDYSAHVPAWGMLANDTVGCCTIAAAGHALQEWTYDAAGAEAAITDAEVLAAYSAVTGYNPADPTTDQGAVCLDVLRYWRKTGVAGHTITAFAQIHPAKHDEVRAAIDLFGAAYIGVNLPTSAQHELDAGQPWSSTTGAPGGWGGHCVIVTAYDETGLTCVTWGQLQRMTWAWWDRYVEEAYAVLSPDWLSKAGLAPNTFDAAALERDLAALGAGGALVGPTPGPAPTPPPAPGPGGASFQVSAAVAARVHALAARAHLTPDQWVEKRLASYLHVAE